MSDQSRPYIALQPGEPAPWFRQRTGDNPDYPFDAAAGRYLVLCFFASSRDPLGAGALKAVAAQRSLFDDARFSFFGVTMDRGDDSEKRLATKLPDIRYFFDFDGRIGKLYGALPADLKPGEAKIAMRRFWVVISPALRVLRLFAFEADGSEQAELFDYLKSLPLPELQGGFARHAPVILLDTIFEPELCRGLVELYETQKRRSDYPIADRKLIQAIQIRVQRRILPEVLKAFQFRASRMEHYIVSSLAGNKKPLPHRGNTTKATAHRRFSVSINLNGDFDGGALIFPEYGNHEFRAPAGGACVFSSALLRADSIVTQGRRYAFQPFLYDDDAARMRAANAKNPGDEIPSDALQEA